MKCSTEYVYGVDNVPVGQQTFWAVNAWLIVFWCPSSWSPFAKTRRPAGQYDRNYPLFIGVNQTHYFQSLGSAWPACTSSQPFNSIGEPKLEGIWEATYESLPSTIPISKVTMAKILFLILLQFSEKKYSFMYVILATTMNSAIVSIWNIYFPINSHVII